MRLLCLPVPAEPLPLPLIFARGGKAFVLLRWRGTLSSSLVTGPFSFSFSPAKTCRVGHFYDLGRGTSGPALFLCSDNQWVHEAFVLPTSNLSYFVLPTEKEPLEPAKRLLTNNLHQLLHAVKALVPRVLVGSHLLSYLGEGQTRANRAGVLFGYEMPRPAAATTTTLVTNDRPLDGVIPVGILQAFTDTHDTHTSTDDSAKIRALLDANSLPAGTPTVVQVRNFMQRKAAFVKLDAGMCGWVDVEKWQTVAGAFAPSVDVINTAVYGSDWRKTSQERKDAQNSRDALNISSCSSESRREYECVNDGEVLWFVDPLDNSIGAGCSRVKAADGNGGAIEAKRVSTALDDAP